MSNDTILRSIQYMQTVYADTVAMDGVSIGQFITHIQSQSVDRGFCQYLRVAFPYHYNDLIAELQKDSPETRTGFWYTSPMSCVLATVADIQAMALQPRLDHLNRTIARLQKKLQPTL